MSPGTNQQACSVCGRKVPRRFCHRNRAGAYICHACQARRKGKGRLAVSIIRARMVIPEMGRRAVLLLAVVLAAALTAALVVLFATT